MRELSATDYTDYTQISVLKNMICRAEFAKKVCRTIFGSSNFTTGNKIGLAEFQFLYPVGSMMNSRFT